MERIGVYKMKKGLTIHFAADADYCGFEFDGSRYGFSLYLGYVVLRVYFVSDALYIKALELSE